MRKAVAADDPDAALEAAREIGRVGIRDALELCGLLARCRDARFERAARHWIALIAREGHGSMAEVSAATAAMAALGGDPHSLRIWEALEALTSARVEREASAGLSSSRGESAEEERT